MTNIDKALFIISSTNDGNNLSPEHLKLTEIAINNHLSKFGQEEFDKLYEKVQQGYQKPWFHGIEHLTIDNEGYVYWKEQHVEHYTLNWAFSEEAKQSAEVLTERCKHLEKHNIPVNNGTAIWLWEKYAELN